MQLQNKVMVVTGASGEGQVGQAIAQACAREGARLVLAARNQEHVQARAAEVRSLGAEALAVAADLTSLDGAQAAIQAAVSQFGRLDVLVNLAGGLTKVKGIEDFTLEDWTAELNNNLLSAFLCSQAAWAVMKEQGGGKIINFARAGEPQARMAAYNCAKAGVVALTRTLALEGRRYNITVNAVGPGLVNTRSNVESMQPKPEDLARWPTREQIAAVVTFLASDAANGVNGQVIEVRSKLL